MAMREELLTLLQLKDIDRTGWVRAGVENPESVAAHSWGMAVLALRLCPEQLDLSKVLSMCLVHDIAEIVVGDLTPHDDIRGEEKHRLEREAMMKIAPQWIELFVYLRQVDQLWVFTLLSLVPSRCLGRVSCSSRYMHGRAWNRNQ